jgi:site-specific DNA recombinase
VRLALLKKKIKISKSQFSDLLKNPIYMGMVKVPAESEEKEYLTKGIHEPIISEALFNKVQNIIKGRKVSKNKPCVIARRIELPLRGILICSKCNHHLTGSPSRGRNGKQHFYYHCNQCKKERYPAQLVNDTVEKILNEITFSSDIQRLYKTLVKDVLGGTEREKEKTKTSLSVAIKQQQDRLEKLSDLLVDGKLSADNFGPLKEKYESEKLKFQAELFELDSMKSGIEKTLELASKHLGNLKEMYTFSDLEGKVRLLGSILPEKMAFDGKKGRTTRINELLRLSLLCDKGFRKNKTGQLSDFLVLSGVVENTGVEPVTFPQNGAMPSGIKSFCGTH